MHIIAAYILYERESKKIKKFQLEGLIMKIFSPIVIGTQTAGGQSPVNRVEGRGAGE